MLGLLVAGARNDAREQLSLSITGPANRDVITGSLNYMIKVTNLSAIPISSIQVNDILPASVRFLSVTNSYARSATISTKGRERRFLFPPDRR